MRDPTTVAGTVREQLPNALVRIELDSGHQVIAHAAEGAGRNFIRLLAGDRVTIELSTVDPGRGRVVRKL